MCGGRDDNGHVGCYGGERVGLIVVRIGRLVLVVMLLLLVLLVVHVLGGGVL